MAPNFILVVYDIKDPHVISFLIAIEELGHRYLHAGSRWGGIYQRPNAIGKGMKGSQRSLQSEQVPPVGRDPRPNMDAVESIGDG